jgi:hypothetical protein
MEEEKVFYLDIFLLYVHTDYTILFLNLLPCVLRLGPHETQNKEQQELKGFIFVVVVKL